jgi:phospholipase/carboxylesterase
MSSTPRFSRHDWGEGSRRSEAQDAGAQNTGAQHPGPRTSSASLSSSPEVILSSGSFAQESACAVAPRAGRARGVFVPENYEPNYAYPLIVWLHDAGRNERDIAEVLPRISTRNYIGLALRGNGQTAVPAKAAADSGAAAGGFGWSRRERFTFQDELHASVRELRRDFHIHPERVFLAGAGEGATMAWDVFLARPEWFAGLAVLGGRFPWRRRPLRQFRALRRKELMITPDSGTPADRSQTESIARLMHAAGLELTVGSPSNGRRLSRSVLRRVDYWIMDSIGGCL